MASPAGLACLTAIAFLWVGAAAAQTGAGQTVTLSAEQLFELADKAIEARDYATAETAWRALSADPAVEVRSEARFRLAMHHVRQGRLPDAAVLLRSILDEQPRAQRVRLELARVLDFLGDEGGARRALREAQAGGLPPDIARMVDRYSAALRAQKSLGASIDMAIAPDSNINRSTRSDTLGTVLGDFVLDEEARQRSGIGAALRAQAYVRLRLNESTNLFGRVSGSADLYRASQFNDIVLAPSFGPEFRSGADRISVEAGGIWRWYGGRPYSRGATIAVNYSHPMGRKAQLRVSARLAKVDNRLNPLLDGRTWSASLGYERALSNRAGIGITLGADRQATRSPGYATWSGQALLFGYRKIGPVSLVATLAYGLLEADERIALFPERRSDRIYRGSLAATFRNLRIGNFAPFLRTTLERNRSNTEIYDYRKLRTEIGISRAF